MKLCEKCKQPPPQTERHLRRPQVRWGGFARGLIIVQPKPKLRASFYAFDRSLRVPACRLHQQGVQDRHSPPDYRYNLPAAQCWSASNGLLTNSSSRVHSPSNLDWMAVIAAVWAFKLDGLSCDSGFFFAADSRSSW